MITDNLSMLTGVEKKSVLYFPSSFGKRKKGLDYSPHCGAT